MTGHSTPPPLAGPEIWAGLECTVNRTTHGYSDQGVLTGHEERAIADLSSFAGLGVTRIRYPVLWEKTAPESGDRLDFSASDERLFALRSLGMSPIVGLLHHGSGPSYTSLLDPRFPAQLGNYAARVAERYPWVDAYTPVNEPLTTARFSGLYGLWYPHGRDDRTFARALYNEIVGTVLAMRAIREVNPAAQLVQTDDLGRAGGTAPMRSQVEFQNERRWLTMDLLFGRVTPQHPLYGYLTEQGGLGRDELDWLVENQYPPDILGINHYPLSNRFLDHRAELYPEHLHANDGVRTYADVGAVDTGQCEPPTAEGVLRSVWHRYRTPFAVTEAHIAGGREAQLRWLHEMWITASRLKREGAPIVAVTAWSLLGAYDWNTLCTSSGDDRRYESGVFDVRWSPPRPTALAEMIRSLAAGRDFEHPLLDRPGYWRDPGRVLYAPSALRSPEPARRTVTRPLVVLGARGQLCRDFSHWCDVRSIDHVLVSRDDLDLGSEEGCDKFLADVSPWAVIDATQPIRMEPGAAERYWLDSARATRNLAAACARSGTRLLTFSTRSVFDGTADSPYRESHPVSPESFYAKHAADTERWVSDVNPDALVVRPGTYFSTWGSEGSMNRAVKALRCGLTVSAAEHARVSATYVPDLVGACLDLVADNVAGILHLTNKGSLSWADWARSAAELVGADRSQVIVAPTHELASTVRRPRYRVLESERVDLLPPFEDAFERFSNDLRHEEMT